MAIFDAKRNVDKLEIIYSAPTFDDVEAIYEMVYEYAEAGAMLARSRNTLYETLRDMVVAKEAGRVVGVGGLHFVWEKLAEVRTMAVLPSMTRHGIGRGIVERLIEGGRPFGVKRVFTLTYKPEFFETLGFHVITKDKLPAKVWKDCIDCPKFPGCDEIAMLREL